MKFKYHGRILTAATKQQALRRIVSGTYSRTAVAAGTKDKVIGMYVIDSSGKVSGERYVARLVSEEKMATLTNKTDGYGRTRELDAGYYDGLRLLDFAKKFTEEGAERAVELMKSSRCAGTYELVILDVGEEKRRISEMDKAWKELTDLCEKELDSMPEPDYNDAGYIKRTNKARAKHEKLSTFVREGWKDVCGERVYLDK